MQVCPIVKTHPTTCALLFAVLFWCAHARAQTGYDGSMPEDKVKPPTSSQRWVFAAQAGHLAFVPYGPNVIRVTFTSGQDDPVVPSGWGTIASPSGETGWTVTDDTLKSNQIVLKVNKTDGTFTATRPDGAPICQYLGGTLTPATVSGKPTMRVDAAFSADAGEHYFGLGQHQNTPVDLRGLKLTVWHDYQGSGNNRQIIGFPFLVSTRNYAILWDNPARTKAEIAVNGKTSWSSEAGKAIAFYLIVADNSDGIYTQYRALTGTAPLPPKAAFGLIQSKARYVSQNELFGVAQDYRSRHYPCDILVVDWFHWKKLGDLALSTGAWPDAKGMNAQLHDMGFHTMITVWPGFSSESSNYNEVTSKKLVLTDANGNVAPHPKDPWLRRDATIDSTNPAARVWLWNKVLTGYRADGFDYFWMDETEPDTEWHDLFCSLGPCAFVYNIYPLVHTSALYEGQRSMSNERVLILARDAYIGAQRNGTTFWSSDIQPTWQALREQIPTGLNMCASGLPYWSSDTAGWQGLPKASHPPHVLLDPTDARDTVGQDDDYPELFVRWFQFSAFCPTFRLHGQRKHNELWSYGKEAEPILVKYAKLRYQLMPYIYAQAHKTEETGAPFMRALFMDFPSDPLVLTVNDEYMFGPAFLVAPVTWQNTTSRTVYLPAGTDWYDYWTNQRYTGGQTITATAPIDTLPLYVRAGSILPLGSEVENTTQPQTITELRIYPGADGDATIYSDDGHTYDYESGHCQLATLHYDDKTKNFQVTGASSLLPSDLHPHIIEGQAGK
jgi:alpha-D-xyloside xylohydrolase